MKAPPLILSCLLLMLMTGCSMDFEGIGRADTPNIDDPQTPSRNDGLSSALIFGADTDNEARLAGGRSAPQRESNQTPPAVPIH